MNVDFAEHPDPCKLSSELTRFVSITPHTRWNQFWAYRSGVFTAGTIESRGCTRCWMDAQDARWLNEVGGAWYMILRRFQYTKS